MRQPRKLPPTVQTLWRLAFGGALGLALMLLTHGLPYYVGVGLFVGCGGTAVGGWLRRQRERRSNSN
jgi:hypothetical protein